MGEQNLNFSIPEADTLVLMGVQGSPDLQREFQPGLHNENLSHRHTLLLVSFSMLFYIFECIYMCMRVYMSAMACTWRSEDKL